MKENLIAIAGAIVGGILGTLAFGFFLHRGLYAFAVPGGLAGIGAGITKNRARWVPIVCAVIALVAGVVAEGVYRPFDKDDSFGYFLKHIFEIESIGMVMIVLGTIIGYWIPSSRCEPAPKISPAP
ncbi:MAG TPA: hypothetical protein VKB78_10860 [Pirellulales bacterium]|nr:hypothetical protein [Pirellulales bacterium]